MPFQQVITLQSMQLTNRPSDFCDHRTAELAAKKRIYCQKQNITVLTLFWGGERGMFLSEENIPWGLSNAWYHPCAISQTFPPASKQCKHVKVASKQGRSQQRWKKKYETCYLPKNTEPSHFLTSSVLLVTCSILST